MKITLPDIRKWCYFFLCLWLSFIIVLSADAYPTIKHIGIEQGLSNNSVRCVYQDHNGFMWFGTYDGLNRYDGYTFKVFRNRLNDSTSLPHNYIYSIHEDLHHKLWIGTGQGIGIYNSLTAKFSPVYYVPWHQSAKQKITMSINAIVHDDAGNVFMGANGYGLLVQKEGAATAIQLPFENGTKQPLLTGNIQSLLIDKNRRLWLFIDSVGLCTYNYTTQKIKLVNNKLKSAGCMQADENDNLWLGSNSGLYHYFIQSDSLVKAFEDVPGELTSNAIASLFLDGQYNLWIGTEGGGVDILNISTGHFNYLLPGQDDASLSSESVFAIYQDSESRKWMGTLKGGINMIDPFKKPFQSFAHDPLQLNSLIYNFTSCFYEDENRNVWIGTDGGGISIWNREQNSFTNFRHEAGNANSLSSNLVSSIRQDYEGNFWIATFGGGINRYNKASGTFEHYRCINSVTGEENKNAWLLYEDRDKNLWATTFSRGRLYRFNRQFNRFDLFDPNLTDLISFTEDAAGKLWAGNSHQLIQVDKQNGKHKIYEIGKPVRAIYEDKKHNFWLGTEGGGLILFDRQAGRIAARFSDADGLCNNSVLNILEDNDGNLWLGTFNGLSKFTPAGKRFKNFDQSDGLQSNQFSYNAALRLRSGELVFGGIKGCTLFNPASLQFGKNTPPVFLTGLRVNNQPVTADSGYVTKTDGNTIQELKIPYDEAVLSVDFAALEYSAPAKIVYAYLLENWDKSWNYTGAIRTANYTHLKEGTYYLRVKCTNATGNWNPKETSLKIIVLPPWYRSWWAYLFYIGIAASLVYVYVHYKTRQTKLEYEVKLAHINAEKEKELNEKKLSFFTDVSHEFRTPLTLIINPLKDVINGGTAGKGELNIVYRNARRLLSLVDQLLLFRKAGSEGDNLKIVKLNFYQLCNDVFTSFIQAAKSKDLNYRFNCNNTKLELYADREKMEIILYNLLSNAIKFTPAGGEVIITVSENEAEVDVKLVDNGMGIPAAVGNKLFERFYRVPETEMPSKPGFGIGLFLVKNFVEKHQGIITYESEPGKGTTFSLKLLKGAAHFGPVMIYEDAPEKSHLLEVASPDKEFAIDKGTNNLEEIISSQKSILIVEDNGQVRQYISSIFKDAFTVYEAQSGDEGIQLAQQHLPDIIISDIIMKNGTGIELCSAIKTNESLSHIPVILLTGVFDDAVKLKGIEQGADDYITKPFEKELLVARVANLIKKRSTLQNYFYNEITLQQNTLTVSEEYKTFLEKCIAIVEAHLDDDQFSIKTLAREIGMSHSNLYKRVKSISGQSVNGFIRFIRLRKAAELFINTSQNVNETAFQVGINDTKYFRDQFHKLFGMNPSAYIKKYRKAFGSSYRVNKEVFGDDGLEPDRQ